MHTTHSRARTSGAGGATPAAPLTTAANCSITASSPGRSLLPLATQAIAISPSVCASPGANCALKSAALPHPPESFRILVRKG